GHNMLADPLIIPLVAWLLVAAVSCFGVYVTQRDRPPVSVGKAEPIVLIIPMRGIPPHLRELWQGICAQTRGPLRVMFALESADDPAGAALRTLSVGPPVEIVIAGVATERGQKIHNMLAALSRLKPSDAIVVFADADIAPAPDWLARLLRELEGDRLG